MILPMEAAIITIGTEITDGQIVDRNSSWLSKKLDELHIRTLIHISVPDKKALMLEALNTAQKTADLIFVCGGLGPTIDDFTRDVVSDFLKQPLQLDEKAISHIEQKITSRGLPLRDGHRRQAMIPKTAQALENSFGVAPGFFAPVSDNKKLWALPGPPKEIEALWNDHVRPHLESLSRPRPELQLQTWLCLGVAESEIAQITEDHFNQFNFKKEFGYRLHVPYVEVKLWYKPSAEAAQALKDYGACIQKHFVAFSTTEAHAPFLELLSHFNELQVVDTISEGLLLEKLQLLVATSRNPKQKINYCACSENRRPQWPMNENTLKIETQRISETELRWVLTTARQKQEIDVVVPAKRTGHYTRLYALEVLLLKASSKVLMTES